MTTRLIGSLIMCHGDDDGLRLPPRIAPKQIVIIPVIPKPELENDILAYAERLADNLRSKQFNGRPLLVHVDKRDKRGGEKNWEWIKKGVPLRIEVGPRDMEGNSAMVSRRDKPHKEKQKVGIDQLGKEAAALLEEIQQNLFDQAKNYRDANICREIANFEELKKFFSSPQGGGFVFAKWCGEMETESLLEELKVSIRCLPLEQSGTLGTCILTGKPATLDVILAKSY